jgi:hypothetical protein
MHRKPSSYCKQISASAPFQELDNIIAYLHTVL